MSAFVLPDLGEGLHEAEILTWHVGLGDRVVADQPLVAVETDKAVVEIPAPRSGVVAALHASEGDIVRVGEPLVEFGDGESGVVNAIVGELAEPPSVSERAAAPAARPRATPAVRAHARRVGVDIKTVTASGPGDTVTIADVDAAIASTTGPGTIEPLRGARRAMDANMARAHAEVASATVTDEVDVGDWEPDTNVMLRLIRALAVACRAEPALNASYRGRDAGLAHNATVELGIAIDTDEGLFVPVLHDVANLPADEIEAALEHLQADVANRSTAPEDLRGQTITLSNFGAIGGRHGVLVVVPPQVAIVGAGRIHEAVRPHDGEPSIRSVLPISLTFDHRVVTGGEAARFLNALTADLRSPT